MENNFVRIFKVRSHRGFFIVLTFAMTPGRLFACASISSQCFSNYHIHVVKTYNYFLFLTVSHTITFVCTVMFGVFRPTREFFTHMKTSPLPVKDCKIWQRSALMAIEQWELFSVLHPLWHGASVYNGKLRGPVTLTTCLYDLGLSRLGFEHPTFRLRGERSYPLRHRRGHYD